MKLKAMLVDDELPILLNLENVLPWASMDIQVVALARNGAEALEAVREHRPDIILCDIRMPVMDGMAFLAELRQIDTECAILMLTGYQEFEYARTAIQHGVREYILKPIDYAQLEQTVRKLAESLRSARAERLKKERQLGEMAHLAYEKILYDVLMGLSEPGERQLLFADDRDAEDLSFSFLLVDIDRYSQSSANWTDRERKLWNFAVGNVLKEALLHFGLTYTALQTREGEWCVLVEHKGEDRQAQSHDAETWLQTLQKAVEENVKLGVSGGIYPGSVPLAALAEAYKNMQRIMLRHSGSGRILSVTEENIEIEQTNRSLWNVMEEIISGLRHLDRGKIEKSLQEMQRGLAADTGQLPRNAGQFLQYVLIHLLREMREMDVVTPGEEEAVWKKLQHSVGMKDVMQTIIQLVDQALTAALGKKNGALLMLSAKDYIHRRLSFGIGVEEVADYLGISCSYFSMLFKSHFGETFVEYVTKQRMEAAKTMLLAGGQSIAKICVLVGYAERRYFTKVFQKYTGMSPSEYRETRGGRGGETG